MNPLSPSSSVSSPTGSPYNPLATSECPNTNAIFCPGSSSSSVTTSPQPSTSTQTVTTASKTYQTAKRKLSESSDLSSESESTAKKPRVDTQPKKATCKRKNIESSSEATSAKRQAPYEESSSDSNDSSTEEGLLQQSSETNASWLRACRYNRRHYKGKKDRLNHVFIQRLQQELNHAQKSLTPEDSLIASLFETAAEQKHSSCGKGPFVFVKQHSGFKNRLDWNKLKKALCCIEASSASSPRSSITQHAAQRAVVWLQRFFACVNNRAWSRTYLSGSSLTHLCAQALAAQGLAPTSDNQGLTRPGGRDGCFISGSDLTLALRDPNYIAGECSLSFLRTPSSRNHDTQRNNTRGENYHLDLEASAARESQTHSSDSDTE